MIKLASVATDPRTAEGFLKLAAALAGLRTLETLSRLITARYGPRLGEAVAVLANPRMLGAVVTQTAVLGSTPATPPARSTAIGTPWTGRALIDSLVDPETPRRLFVASEPSWCRMHRR